MAVTMIVVIAAFLVYCDVCQAIYSLECPEKSHWKMRADSKCNGIAGEYHCLYDQNNKNITEFCASPNEYTTGFMAVYNGNIDADLCPDDRYMPFNFKSNMTKSCMFLKSKCISEGQLEYHHWSLAEDAACMCDFSNGYTFVKKPKNNCLCVPSLEDCSCYKKKKCKNGYILSPDYVCIASRLVKTQPSDSHNFQCHPNQNRIKLLTRKKTTLLSPCLSDVSSIKEVPRTDRSLAVKIIIGITTITIAFASCLTLTFVMNEGCLSDDKAKNQNDNLNSLCQTEEALEETTPKQLSENPVEDKLNADDYFKINCEYSSKHFYDGVKLKDKFDKKPRILDMCFVDFDNEIRLVYIDADNKMIVVRCISNNNKQKEEMLTHEPNRLAKINNTTVGVIYKKELHILIFDVKKMEQKISYSIIEGSITKSRGRIQGILALSPTELILSDKIHLFRCNLDEQMKTAQVNSFASALKDFDTARRLTHVTVHRSGSKDIMFVADENDKKLTSIDTKNGNFIGEHTGHNRGLQNVRAIGATEHRIYAATSAGISVFCHKKGIFKKFDNTDYKMLVEYGKHVDHTRGLCIHLDKDYIYIGLSCVIKHDDVILIFKFKPNNSFN